jgi:hypothetical protein
VSNKQPLTIINYISYRLGYSRCLCSITQSYFSFSFSSGEGKHWFLVYRASKQEVEYFDPLGGNANFIKSIIKFGNTAVFNKTSLQSENSTACGFYILYFILNRYLNRHILFSSFMNPGLSF